MLIDRNNPMAQLNTASSTHNIVKKECNVQGDVFIHSDNLYKKEDYEFKSPGFLGLFPKKLNAAEVLDRLSKGKEVIVNENIQMRGTYDGLDGVADRQIAEQKVTTSLKSTEDLEAFGRVEGGGTPKTEEEMVARLLENIEYKSVPGKNDNNFYEILDKKDKPLSSTEAAKRLNKGEAIQLREVGLNSSHSVKSRAAKSAYGKWLVDPNNLAKNEKLVERKTAYGGRVLYVESHYNRIEAEPTESALAFNSLSQLKEYLSRT
jgi:hypothetical protein